MRNFKWFLFTVILFGISIVPLFSLFTSGLPVTNDGQDHVARIANFYQSLSEGNIIPRWAGNLNWGYGHPILMFLYPLPSYLGSLFHSMGFSFVGSVNLVFIVSYIASIFAMYLWMKTAFGKPAGVIGAILYNFAPYRFVDLYVRGAIGEHVAFVFPPLILYASLQLAKKKDARSYGCLLASAFAFLILSHNAFSLMFLPVIALYVLYLFFAEAKRSIYFILGVFSFILLGFGIAAFFWVPALLEGKYTLRDIVTKGEALQRFVPVSMFFYSPWNYGGGNETTKFLGFPQWLGILGSIVLFWKTKERTSRLFIGGALTVLVLTLFIMTSASKFIWERLMILQNFQFPWRFQSVSVFITAVLVGISIPYLLKNIPKQWRRHGGIAFCIISILLTANMWYPKGYTNKHESFYSGIYQGTTDTGESSPIWSVRFMEHTPARSMEVIDGVANIQEESRTSVEHVYKVTAEKPSRLVENTLFFPGWKIYVDDLQAGLQFQDPDYRGLMTFRIDEGEHVVRVVFGNTKVCTYAEYISLISIGICMGAMILRLVWRKQ